MTLRRGSRRSDWTSGTVRDKLSPPHRVFREADSPVGSRSRNLGGMHVLENGGRLGDRSERLVADRGGGAGAEAQHPRHHGRRHRLLEHQRLQPRHDGLPHAQHRPHRQRGRRCSPTITPSSPAPRAAPLSSPARAPSAPACSRSACPRRKEGLSDKDPTLAELLKPEGYATGQFGKNHLGDRNEFLPTVHGFDEFFGNLYHLNAEEEPENPDYPKNPEFKAQIRTARRAEMRRDRHGRRPARTRASARGASRSARTPGR